MKPRVGNILNELNTHFKRPETPTVAELPVDKVDVFNINYSSPIDVPDSIWTLEDDSKYCTSLRFNKLEILIKFIDLLLTVHSEWVNAPKLCFATETVNNNVFFLSLEIGNPMGVVSDREVAFAQTVEDIITLLDEANMDTLESILNYYEEDDIGDF